MIDQENNCTAILEFNKSLGSTDFIFFLRIGECAQQARKDIAIL